MKTVYMPEDALILYNTTSDTERGVFHVVEYESALSLEELSNAYAEFLQSKGCNTTLHIEKEGEDYSTYKCPRGVYAVRIEDGGSKRKVQVAYLER